MEKKLNDLLNYLVVFDNNNLRIHEEFFQCQCCKSKTIKNQIFVTFRDNSITINNRKVKGFILMPNYFRHFSTFCIYCIYKRNNIGLYCLIVFSEKPISLLFDSIFHLHIQCTLYKLNQNLKNKNIVRYCWPKRTCITTLIPWLFS